MINNLKISSFFLINFFFFDKLNVVTCPTTLAHSVKWPKDWHRTMCEHWAQNQGHQQVQAWNMCPSHTAGVEL